MPNAQVHLTFVYFVEEFRHERGMERVFTALTILAGLAIASNCLRIQFCFQRHILNVTDLLLKTLEQKVVTFFL